MQAALADFLPVATAAALCGATWWAWPTGKKRRGGADAFEAAWEANPNRHWHVGRWDAPTVYAFLSGHPRLAPLRPFSKALWSDVDGESLLAMTGADFTEEKRVPSYAVKKLMRCVCAAAERGLETGITEASMPIAAAAADAASPRRADNKNNTTAANASAVTLAATSTGARTTTTPDDRLAQSLLACSYFTLLRRSEIDLLVLNATQRTYPPSTPILITGEPASYFSIVLEGSVQRITRGDVVADQGFHHFGAQFIVKQGSVPTTSVRAGPEGCRLFMISSAAWQTLLKERGLRWAAQANRRMMLSVRHRFGKYLQQVSFLSNVDRSSLDVLGSLFNTQSFARGESILVQGEPSKGFYLIMRGTVEIQVPQVEEAGGSSTGSGDGGPTPAGAWKNNDLEAEDGRFYESRYLCDTDAHNYFGEVSLMSDGHVVSASVIAAQPAMLLHISPQSFKQFLTCTGDEVAKELRVQAALRGQSATSEVFSGGHRIEGEGCRDKEEAVAAAVGTEAKVGRRRHVAAGSSDSDSGCGVDKPKPTKHRAKRRFSGMHPHNQHPMLTVASFTPAHVRAHDNIRVQLETGFAVPPTPAVELWD